MSRIVFHRGKQRSTGLIIEGFLTKMWGEYHIIPDDDENMAYEIEEDSIEPILN